METIQATAPRTRRFLGKVAAGGALAALFGSRLATLTSAASRKMAIAQANAFIADCFANGGEPDAQIDDESGYVTATCGHGDDVETDSCTYYYDDPNPFCFSDMRVPPGLGHIVGGVIAGGNLVATRKRSAGASGAAAKERKGRRRGAKRRAAKGRGK